MCSSDLLTDISGRLLSFGRLIASVGEGTRVAELTVSSPAVDILLTSVVGYDSIIIYYSMDKMANFLQRTD